MAIPKPPRRMRRWIFIIVFLILVMPVIVLAAWTWVALKISYSNGERVGYVQKISQKGWACKTWEGELAQVNIPGTTPQIFAFSVRDDAVARRIMDGAGKHVSLTYEQHRGVPTECFGETEFFITGVKVLPQ